MKLYKFRFRLQHDNGSVIIQTIDTGLKQAVKRVCDSENCPQSAIRAIYCKPLKPVKQ